MRVFVQRLALAAIAAVAVFALFAPAIAFSFIGVDDAAYTFRNPFVAAGVTFGNIVEAATNLRHGGIWMPVTYVSYMIDASVSRLTGVPFVAQMHFVNAALHAVNFLLFLRFMKAIVYPSAASVYPSAASRDAVSIVHASRPHGIWMAVAALVWAVHPMRAEPVAWIAARKELLWTMFALAGLLFWIRHLGRSHDAHFRVSPPWIGAFLCCVLSCLSKPTAMCFPLLAALVEWLRCDGANGGKRSPRFILRRARRYLPLLAVAAATAAVAAYSQTHVAGQETTSLYAGSFFNRLVGAVSALGFYIRATLWPAGLHIDCRTVSESLPIGFTGNVVAFGCGVCVVALLTVSSRLAARGCSFSGAQTGVRRTVVFSVAWFLVSAAPTLGILGSFGVEAHSDRFAYLPAMAFSILFAALAVRWIDDAGVRHPRGRRKCAFAVSAMLIAVLSAATVRQLGFWRDDGEAYRRALDCDSGHPRAMVHVADAQCSRRRDFDGGIALYRKALTLADTVPAGGFNRQDVRARLAYALASRGGYDDFDEVKRLGADVLRDFRLDRRGMMLDALGTAFLRDGDMKRAALLFKASMDAPNRFWPKASTKKKLEMCR